MWHPPVKRKKFVNLQKFDKMSVWPTLNCFKKNWVGGEKSAIYFWKGQWWSIGFVWVFKMWDPPVKRKKIVKLPKLLYHVYLANFELLFKKIGWGEKKVQYSFGKGSSGAFVLCGYLRCGTPPVKRKKIVKLPKILYHVYLANFEWL